MLTKNDLANIGKVVDQKLDAKLDEKLDPIKKKIDSIDKKLTLSIKLSQTESKYHHLRLVELETKTGVKRPPYPTSN